MNANVSIYQDSVKDSSGIFGDEYWEAKAVTVMITLKGFVKLEELSRKKRSVFEKYGRFTI